MGMATTIVCADGIGARAATGDDLQKQVSAVATAMAVILDSRVDRVDLHLVLFWTAACSLEILWFSTWIFSLLPKGRS